MTQAQTEVVKNHLIDLNKIITPTRLVYTSSHHTGSPFYTDYENSWWIEIVFEEHPRLARCFYDSGQALAFLDGIEKAFDYIKCSAE